MSPRPPRRRGECPALTRPMETGDGLLVRLVPAEGTLSPAQLRGLAEAAQAFGNGLLEVTARGSVQLRGLSPETVGPLNQAVEQLAITPRAGIAIDLSPLSGLDPAEVADARPLAALLGRKLAQEGIADRLGAKVSVVLDGAGTIALDSLSADVRLRAMPSASGVLWQVALAGDGLSARPVAQLPAEAAIDEAVAWLKRLAALGRAARMGDVLAASGGVGGETRQGPHVDSPNPAAPIGRFPLIDGTFAQGVALPFGQSDAASLMAFADAAAREGARDLRPAPSRVLLACGLTQAGADRLAAEAETLGFLTRPDDPRAAIAACPGAPACHSAHMPARALAGQVARALAPLLDRSVTVHLSACTKGCAHPAPATLTLVGMDEGVGLVREGTAGSVPERVLPLDALPVALDSLVRAAAESRRPEESARAALIRADLFGLADRAPDGRTTRRKTMLESH